MLSEHFIASIGTPAKAPGTNVAKDAAIFVHETQPTAGQRAIFKRSATPPNCLAVSSTHIFAAQIEKAVVHVYSREKGNQEATVPFTERITCLVLACEDAVLVLGTREGRIFLWEVATGRQVSTTQAHLRAINALSVDARSNFLVSASADSTCHVWSLPSLLSFANAGAQPLAPLYTFSSHRAVIQAMAICHNESFHSIAITAAQDKTCLVWNYHTNTVLRTYLLPTVPTCIALDAADRTFYIGYEDGSIQRIDLITTESESLHAAADALAPVQAKSARWASPDTTTGSVLSLTVSFDGTILLSGHQSGAVLSWDVVSATGHMKNMLPQGPLPGPVTNLAFLPVAGFADQTQRRVKLDGVVKPKFGAFQESETGSGAVPGSYALNVQLKGSTRGLSGDSGSLFSQALHAPTFPSQLLDDGLNELAARSSGMAPVANGGAPDAGEDFMALDEPEQTSVDSALQHENAELKAQLQALRRVQSASLDKLEKLHIERQVLLQRERKRYEKPKMNGAKPGAKASSSSEGDEVMGSNDDSESD